MVSWKLILGSAVIIAGLVIPASGQYAGNPPETADSDRSYAELKNAVTSSFAGKKDRKSVV